jgi:hypothetical protein
MKAIKIERLIAGFVSNREPNLFQSQEEEKCDALRFNSV